MASKQDLMGLKQPAALASVLGHDPLVTVSAAGSTQAGATQLTGNFANVTVATSNQGVILPSGQGQAPTALVNTSGQTIKVYPFGTETINGGSAGAAVSVPNGKAAVFYPSGQTWIAVVSA